MFYCLFCNANKGGYAQETIQLERGFAITINQINVSVFLLSFSRQDHLAVKK